MTKKLLLLFILISSTYLSAREITITSLNIKYFGLGGEFSGTKVDEFRESWIREFMIKNNLMSDVLIFQEIVDKEQLRKMLGFGYWCSSYNNTQENHQHVVICYFDSSYDQIEYLFDRVAGDNNYIIDESALLKYRPAVYGVLKDGISTDPLLRVVGVHLKAKPQFLETRKQQATIIKNALQKLDQKIPTLIIGDFNLYGESEENALSDIFNELGLVHVENNSPTYRGLSFEGIFDHVWLSGNIKHSELRVTGPCSLEAKDCKRFDNRNFYNKFVSDHAAITLSVEIE